MFPTKSMFEYLNEMNRLFPRNNENDKLPSPPTTAHQFYTQSSMVPSSSSTDTSPDSFPDMTASRFPSDTFQHHYEAHFDRPDREGPCNYENQRSRQYRPHHYENLRTDQYGSQFRPADQEIPFMSQQIYETPFAVRRQRPIVGRKIMAASEAQIRVDEASKVWTDDSTTLPNTSVEQKFNQNTFYELFPTENKAIGFKTPVKTSPNSFTTSPKMSDLSPKMPVSARMTNICPSMTNMSTRMTDMSHTTTNMSPRMADMSPKTIEISPSRKISPGSSAGYSPRFSFKEPILGASSSYRQNMGSSKMCTFCRKNGETPLVYMTHSVKEKVGNKNVVTCPILRSHVCSTCGASGDNAHTITYCPILRSGNNGQPLQSTTITLKNTRVKSNGRRRY